MAFPLTPESAASTGSHSLQRVVEGFGAFPDAIFDFAEVAFNKEGARLVARAYRSATAAEPLPLADPIILDLSWDEIRTSPNAGELEGAIRDAAWALMTSHPRMLRGTPPQSGEQDTRHNVFAGGQLVDTDAQ